MLMPFMNIMVMTKIHTALTKVFDFVKENLFNS
jgi:hypothetical protein